MPSDQAAGLSDSATEGRIGVIGLGYVGLPLAAEFAKHRAVLGFDINPARIAELQRGFDRTCEVEAGDLASASQLVFSSEPRDLAQCTVFIVTVPTPIDDFKRPDMGPLLSASRTVGLVLKRGDLVIYESTVYPGATEEECVPVLEKESGLTFNDDFFVGYSPERINPGDKQHRLTSIVKVTSGSTTQAAEAVDRLYGSIITAGTHRAPSIKVAEAAKVIENTQRDLNIALVNELALIFDKMNIDTLDVLDAAGTKWNFLPFRPGLVGGHCISVDPYYLTHKAQALGYQPEVVLAGRRINDAMGGEVAMRLIRGMIRQGATIRGARVLILGLTFKENCPDLRNTRVLDIVHELTSFGVEVELYDPLADPEEAMKEYGLTLTEPRPGAFDGIILAVAHDEFRSWGAEVIRALGRDNAIVFDLKGLLPRSAGALRL